MGFIKKLFKFFFMFIIFIGLGIAALLFFGKSSGEDNISAFFKMVEKSSISEIQTSIHPLLAKECDAQRLAEFIKAIPATFGSFKNINTNGFSFSDNYKNGVRTQKYEGTMAFEKQEVPLELKFVDGKLIGIHLKDKKLSEKILESLNTVPENSDNYQKIGKEFWKNCFDGNIDSAFNMLAEVLQKKIGKTSFAQMFKKMNQTGKCKNIRFEKIISDPKTPKEFILIFRLDFQKSKNISAHVNFQYGGLKCYLIGFNIPSPYAK